MKRWKRRLGRGCLGLVVLASLGALGGLLYVRSHSGGLNAELARAKAYGFELHFQAFTDTSKIPSAENAAADFVEVAQTMAALGGSANAWLGNGTFTVDAASAAARRSHLQPFGEVFKKLEVAAIKPTCRFQPSSLDGGEGSFKRFAELRQFARLLCARAALEAFEGRWGAAGRSLTTAARIARHAGDEHTQLSMLARVGIEGIVLKTAQHALGQPRYSAAAIQPMREALAALKEPPDFSTYLRGEVCVTFNAFDPAVQSSRSGGPGLTPGWFPSSLAGMALRAYQARLLMRWNDLFDRMGKPPVDPGVAKSAIQKVSAEIGRSIHPADQVLGIMLPVYEQEGDSLLTLIARRRLLAQALLLLAFHERSAGWPSELSDIGQLFDPFDGKSLRYLPRPDGFVLYSIGKDGVDDKGGKGDEVFEFPAK